MKYFKFKKYYVLIILIMACLFLLVFSLLMKKDRKTTNLENIIKDSVIEVNKKISIPINNIKKSTIKRSKLIKKYEKMKEKYEKDKNIRIENEELKEKISDLENILELNKNLKNDYINANVIVRNVGYFYNEITVDKGLKEKVKKGMAAMTSDGLIGTVNKVSNHTSVIKLITTNDTNNKISVKIKLDDHYIYGLLSGYDTKNKYFLIEGIANNENIPMDSLVTTTSLGNGFPSGILIGRVKKIKKDNFDLSRTLLVKSDVDFNNIEYVVLESGDKR